MNSIIEQVNWKYNLWIAWLGSFLTSASLFLVVPFISLYVEELGARGDAVAFYAGVAISLSAISAALLAPVWGNLADRYGRKVMMVRASFVMTFTIGGLAFIPNIAWLIFLRLLNGVFAGYIPNATALIASQTPKDKSGYALSTLSSSVVTGSLIGPFVGGLLAETIGIRKVFLLAGILLLAVTVFTFFFIKEDFHVVKKEEQIPVKELFQKMKHKKMLFGLFITSMIIQTAAQSISPILPLYIRSLGQKDNITFVSGLIVSAMGISSVLSASFMGKLGDRIGNHRLMLLALIYSFIIYIFCANAHSPLQLGVLRFLFGLGTGALTPGVNSILSKITPKEGISRIFSYNQSFYYLGGVIGPMFGSIIATSLGYHWVFYGTAILVLINFIQNFFNFKNYLYTKDIS